MNDKYIYFAIFFIIGIISIIVGLKYHPPKYDEEYPDITRLRFIMGGALALLGALFALIYG